MVKFGIWGFLVKSVRNDDDDGNYPFLKDLGGQASRKGFKSVDQSKPLLNFDHDENKYKQKSTFAWISRWWKNSLPSSRVRRAGGLYRRYWIMLFVVIALVIVLLLLSHRDVDIDSPFGSIQDDDRRILQKN